MRRKTYAKGFTLVELALSMVFVGILSLAIALIISDTIGSYRRGLTLNEINTTGMDIVDDIRTAVQNASGQAVTRDCYRYYGTQGGINSAYDSDGKIREDSNLDKCLDDNAYSFVYLEKKSNVKITGDDGQRKTLTNIPIYGAFCTGEYSYIWNSGYFELDDAEFWEKERKEWAKLLFSYGGETYIYYKTAKDSSVGYVSINNYDGVSDGDRPFRLLKVNDSYRAVCANLTRTATSNGSGYTHTDGYEERNGLVPSVYGNGTTFNGIFTMVGYQSYLYEEELPVDVILTDKTNDLAIYNLYVPRPAISTTQKNMFYSVSFILGTIGGGIDVTANGKSCAAPNDYNIENFDYCSINKFNFAVQVGGE